MVYGNSMDYLIQMRIYITYAISYMPSSMCNLKQISNKKHPYNLKDREVDPL